MAKLNKAVQVAIEQQADYIDRLVAENKALREALEYIAHECEGVFQLDIIDHAEKRTWQSIGKLAKAALARAGKGK